jgi:hypothetical protein
MSNIQRAGHKVWQELQQPVQNGQVRYANLDKCIGMRHYSNGRYGLEVEKTVKDMRYKEFISGGTARNIDEMMVAAYEARKRVYRQAEAYRKKLETTQATQMTTAAPQLTTSARQLTTPAPQPTTPAVTTLPEVYTRFAIIGLSFAASFIIGWLIGGAL